MTWAAAVVVAATLAADTRFEVKLLPLSAQVNVLQTEHVGSGGALAFHFHRLVGVYVEGKYLWHAERSAAQRQLEQEVVRTQPFTSTPTLLTWWLHAGVQSVPLEGTWKLGTREGTLGLEVRLGLGPAGSRVTLLDSATRTTYGDAGLRLAGHGAVGLRFGLGAFAIHTGVHVAVWGTKVSAVNGCSEADLRALQAGDQGVTSGCAFADRVEVPSALLVVGNPPEPVSASVSAELGISFSL